MPKQFLHTGSQLICILTLICCISLNSLSGQDVILQGQASVDAFDPGTTHITGNLTFKPGGTPITDISNLSNLEYIGGSLIIERTGLVNLDAFSKLDTIGADLSIFSNKHLKHIDGLSNLEGIGEDLIMFENDSLERIASLTGISSVPGDLKIYNNALLLTLDGLHNISSIGGLTLLGNESLTNIQRMSGLTMINGDCVISNNDSLKRLDGLENLTEVSKDFYLTGTSLNSIEALSSLQFIGGNFNVSTTSLTDLMALSGLDSIGGSLDIKSNPGMVDLKGLQKLSKSGPIHIESNSALKHISGFPNLTITGGLRITINYALEDITGFHNLNTINGELYIYGNHKLNNFSGFSNIQTADIVVIGENNLSDLEGLSGLTSIGGNLELALDKFKNLNGLAKLSTVGGRILIWRCNSLLNVNGFSGLTTLGGNLDISQNEDLVNIDSLSNLISVQGNVGIGGNNVLTDVDGLSSLTTIGGSLNISGDGLQNVDGLLNVTTVGGSFAVNGSAALTNLNSLGKLTTVGENFNVGYRFTDIDSLSNLTHIGGTLTILSTRLKNVDGLHNLRTVGAIHIFNNHVLTNVDGLQNLSFVGGKFEIFGNKVLSPCCGIKQLLERPGLIGGNIKIQENSTECNSIDEILSAGNCGIVSVFNDINSDCIRNSGEAGLINRRVLVEPGSYIFLTDYLGRIDISYLPLGVYSMVIDTVGPWGTDCSIERTFELIIPDTFPSIAPFPLTIKDPCTSPLVTLEMSSARPCFEDQRIFIQACNGSIATGPIDNAFIIVTLDSILTFQSASHSHTQLSMNMFKFELGDIYPGECITIEIKTMVDCDAALGQTLCIKSELFPVDTCVFDDTPQTFQAPSDGCNEAYEGSHIEVVGHCTGDSIRFLVSNVTDKESSCTTPVRLFADTELLWNNSLLLSANEQQTFIVPADGKTYRMEADQHPEHPGISRPNATVERCGDLMNWTPGLVSAFYFDDSAPIVDIFCTEIRGSFDPNDKIGYPLGITEEHLVLPNQLMEYRIRFQNTGTDTAFTVVILDTLDTDLNIFSVTPGVTSHPSSFRMFGQRILEWKFDNILLPDSTTNETGSHGFVTFQVQQNRDLENGTLLSNRAGIYFDFNDTVITNTTRHVVNDQIQGIISSVPDSNPFLNSIRAFPNPTSGRIQLAFATPYKKALIDVFTTHGQRVFHNTYTSNDLIEFELDDPGLYFIRVQIGLHVETLKVVVN